MTKLKTLFEQYFFTTYIFAVLVGLSVNERVAGPITVFMAFVAFLHILVFRQIQLGSNPLKNPNHRWIVVGLALLAWSFLSMFWGVGGFNVVNRPIKQLLFLFSAIILIAFVSIHKDKQYTNYPIFAVLFGIQIIIYFNFFQNSVNLGQDAIAASYYNKIFITTTLISIVISGAVWPNIKMGTVAIYVITLLLIPGYTALNSYSLTSFLIWLFAWACITTCFIAGEKFQKIILAILCSIPIIMPFSIYFGSSLIAKLLFSDSSLIGNSSAIARLDIWKQTICLIMNQPITGYGNTALKLLTDNKPPKVETICEGERVLSHPHSAILEIWLEFGAIGAILMCLMLVTVSIRIVHLADPYRPFAIASFGVVLLTNSVSHGAWQSWWLGTMILLSTIAVGYYRCR